MKYRKLSALIIITVLLFTLPFPRPGYAAESKETIRTEFDCGFGMAYVNLRKDFAFLNHDSGRIDWDLALTAVTLSGHIYNDMGAQHLMDELGYEYTETKASNDRLSEYKHPAASFGYKHLTMPDGKEANVFAVVVRGTQNNPTDIKTDILDGALTMFRDCGNAVRDDLFSFMKRATGKSTQQLQKEENYFFLTGHSLGGATANYLSIEEQIMKLAHNDKGRIYTYTFSAPHTCINLWWTDPESESNAFNIKDADDFVTHVPPYPGATTYGKDLYSGVNDLDDTIFRKIFPKAKGGSVTEAPKVTNYPDAPWGHHDRGLCLVYILQNGLAAGTWNDLGEAAACTETVKVSKEIMPLFSMNYGEVKSQYGGTFEHVRGPLFKNLLNTSLGLDFSFYFSPEAEDTSGSDWEAAYFNEWNADPVRSVSGPAKQLLTGMQSDWEYRKLAECLQVPDGYTMTSAPNTEVVPIRSNADPEPVGYQYCINFGLSDGCSYTICSTDTKIIGPDTTITMIKQEGNGSDPSGGSSGNSSGSSGSSEGNSGSSGGASGSTGGITEDSDISAYGIPNGTYLSSDGFNQEFTFYGTDGIRMSAFGISADGTYEVSGGRIIVTYEFLGTQVWDPTFSMSGDCLYIAGTAFYKQ